MKRETELALLEAALAMALEKRRPIDGPEVQVPVADYVDRARFARELDRVFRRELNVVTLSPRVAAPGDFVTADVVGAPIPTSASRGSRAR